MCQSQSGFVSNAPSLNVLQKTNVSSPFTTTLSTTLSIKLDRDDFLLWKSQVLPTTRGHGIEDYLFGTKPQPPEFLESQDEHGHNIRIINSIFEHWNKKNQLLLSWLLFSLSTVILSQVARCTTSHELWITLEHLFTLKSKAKLLQLKMQIQSLRKGSMTMSDYFAKMENTVDQCAMAGCFVSEEDLVFYILASLGSEYDPIICSITTHNSTDHLSLKEIHDLLLNHESRIEQLHATTSDSHHLSANFVAHKNEGNHGRGKGNLNPQG